MSLVDFTNSLNYTRSFTEIELNAILTTLNASNTYYTNGLNNLVFIRISLGNLVLLDLNFNINRRLFELFSFQYALGNPFNLKLIHNNTAVENTIDGALLSVGYSGTIPILSLENVFMKLYTNANAGHFTIDMIQGLQTALDGKVDDSQVLTDVPADAVFTDTMYAHPNQHSMSEIAGLQSALDSNHLNLYHNNVTHLAEVIEFKNCLHTSGVNPVRFVIEPIIFDVSVDNATQTFSRLNFLSRTFDLTDGVLTIGPQS